MKQILQSLQNGQSDIADVPALGVVAGKLLIVSRRSLVSAGTERMLVNFGRGGWIAKARQQPDKVLQVLDKVRTDGLMTTVEAVQSKLDEPLALGYCNVGVVDAVGVGVEGFSVGDRIASSGPHAEMVSVPRNLCARIPEAVSDEEAAFTVIGAIGLQGIRLANPTLGETFVVTGLGLVGLVTVQLLRAAGCRVLGIDPDPAKAEMARAFGAETVALDKGEDPVSVAAAFSRGRGVDGVLITASTKSNEPVSQAARMCRKRGRIVLVGVVGLELSRADFFEKELTFQVSCSYGPGRYDEAYEQKGQDYPAGFVRWTEQRNFEAVLDMMASGALDVKPLITHRFPFEQAPKAYDLLASGSEPYLGILLEYPPGDVNRARTVHLGNAVDARTAEPQPVRLGVIGAGNYAGRVLIPAFARTGAALDTIANSGGINGVHYGRKHGFQKATTAIDELMVDANINAVVIATRHDSHARFVSDALRAGKHVFCEKPLALTLDELQSVEQAYQEAGAADTAPLLMVGFNRRFSPLTQKMKTLLAAVGEPKSFVITVNAGAIPAEHWTQDVAVGGGRIIGEACHFIDLMRFLAGTSIVGWGVQSVARGERDPVGDDKATIHLTFADGSFGSIHYLASGHRSFPKERIEAFCAGRVLQLDNFRRLRAYGWPGFKGMRLWRQDKGQRACAAAFVDAIGRGEAAPIVFNELLEVSRVTIEAGVQARGG
ncbi:MAG: bi-domain-containing oxidoreductase [Aquisalimonadaceae bacterium]